jgi:hypothetical protein
LYNGKKKSKFSWGGAWHTPKPYQWSEHVEGVWVYAFPPSPHENFEFFKGKSFIPSIFEEGRTS